MFSIFKLYPWEAMVQEEFGIHAIETYQSTRWIEPIWKLLLSNKGILPILWQLYPNHELLLEAHFDTAPTTLRDYVRKPLYSREGANITIVRNNTTIASTDGPYNGRQIVQALAPEAVFPEKLRTPPPRPRPLDGRPGVLRHGHPQSPRTPITDNLSSFVPHTFPLTLSDTARLRF